MRKTFQMAFSALAATLIGAMATSCSDDGHCVQASALTAENPMKPSQSDFDAAEKGDHDACLKVGRHYFQKAATASSKEAADKDYALAFKFLSTSAAAGDVGSRIRLGLMQEGGLGVKEDAIAAARNYRIASDTGSPEGQCALAAFWRRIGSNLEDAEALVRKAIKTEPSNPNWRMELAATLYAEGKLDEGAKQFDEIKSLFRDKPIVMEAAAAFYASRAALQLQEGSEKEALASFERALEFRPDDIQLLEIHASACIQAGDAKRAAPLFDGLIRRNPDRPTAYAARAGFRKMSGDLDGAVADLQKAIEIAPSDVKPHVILGGVHSAAGRKDMALLQFAEALKLAPSCREALWLRANLKAATNDLDGALEDYDALIKLEPADPRALIAKAQALHSAGQYGKAAGACGKAIKLNPSDPAAYVCRANSLLALGDSAAAEADCTSALELAPSIPFAHSLRGRARMAAGREQEAIDDFNAALKIDQSDAQSLFSKASIMLKQGKAQGVLSILRRSPVTDSDYSLLLLRVRAALLAKERESAIADLDKALAINGDRPDAWSLKAFTLLDLRRFAEAERAATRAIDLGGKDSDVFFARGRARMELGRPERAISDFDSIVELSPSDANAYQLRGAAKSLAGRYSAALADFQKASGLDRSAPFQLDLSEALVMDKQPEQAYDVASRILADKPEALPCKAVALYLKCVAGMLTDKQVGEELAAFDDTMKADFSPEWSTDSFERWLANAHMQPEVKRTIAELTARLKAKQVGSEAR